MWNKCHGISYTFMTSCISIIFHGTQSLLKVNIKRHLSTNVSQLPTTSFTQPTEHHTTPNLCATCLPQQQHHSSLLLRSDTVQNVPMIKDKEECIIFTYPYCSEI